MAAADIVIGAEDKQPVLQLGAMSNRHGLVAGATGTGKTVTLQVLAEGFSRMGVPVFAADVKGDLSGIAAPGKPNKETDRRLGADSARRLSAARLSGRVLGRVRQSRVTRCARRCRKSVRCCSRICSN